MAKKGIRRAKETEIKKGQHLSVDTEFPKGLIPWNKGMRGVYHFSPESIEKARQSHIGLRYDGGEHWITKICLKCGKPFEVKKGEGKNRKYCTLECARTDRKSKGFVTKEGYKVIRHNQRKIYKHRLVAEQMLGRPLKKTEIVHHNNGDKLDNRKENLTVMSQARHRALVDYLAGLWIKEHPNEVDKVTLAFASGG